MKAFCSLTIFEISRMLAPMLIAIAAAAAVMGTYQGEIQAGSFTLHLVLTVTAGGEGKLRVPEQGNVELPIAQVTQDGSKIAFAIPSIGARYTGELKGDTINGTWEQGGKSMPVAFKRTETPLALRRPQEPQPPFPYDEEQVRYRGPAGLLAGTFSHPHGKGPFPAILLITGSGPQNRDEEIFGHKPFKLLADVLTRRGVAVLRVDDRGVGASEGDPRVATSADFAEDARAGVAYLRARAEVDPNRVGLLGHSEGGVIAPMLCATDPRIAFEVLLAGPGVNGGDLIARQARDLMARSGMPAAQLAGNAKAQDEVIKLVRTIKDPEALKEQIKAVLRPLAREDGHGHALLTPAEVDQQAEAAASPWFRYFVNYDPASTLARVKAPTLALNGDLDLQVPADQNLKAIAKANPAITTRVLPHLNHLFQTAKTGLPAEYATIEETMAPVALDAIAAWVVLQAKP
ncbi:MAG: alpha/beta hydrolase [Cyanobacteria bacterium RYN_339]|nr:alpha/beta hydrolase [Cyanobacteria bacterium RYN_339]